MKHSVKSIGKRYSQLSIRRKDEKLFNFDDFMDFAIKNKKKYSLIENGEDLFVSTWYYNDLIQGYIQTI